MVEVFYPASTPLWYCTGFPGLRWMYSIPPPHRYGTVQASQGYVGCILSRLQTAMILYRPPRATVEVFYPAFTPLWYCTGLPGLRWRYSIPPPHRYGTVQASQGYGGGILSRLHTAMVLYRPPRAAGKVFYPASTPLWYCTGLPGLRGMYSIPPPHRYGTVQASQGYGGGILSCLHTAMVMNKSQVMYDSQQDEQRFVVIPFDLHSVPKVVVWTRTSEDGFCGALRQ
jgi:hypothetical protein